MTIFHFLPKWRWTFFYAKLSPDSCFVTYLEGFYIFLNLNFDLPIPRGLWEVVRIPFHEKYRWNGLVTWWERVMANYKYTYQIWWHLDKSHDVEYQLKIRLQAYSRGTLGHRKQIQISIHIFVDAAGHIASICHQSCISVYNISRESNPKISPKFSGSVGTGFRCVYLHIYRVHRNVEYPQEIWTSRMLDIIGHNRSCTCQYFVNFEILLCQIRICVDHVTAQVSGSFTVDHNLNIAGID